MIDSMSLRARYPVEPAVDEILTRKLMKRNEKRHNRSQTLEEVTERLSRFLAARVEAPATIRNLNPMSWGTSKEPFSFDIDWVCTGKKRRAERMVLRCEPDASIVETSRRREYELMQFDGTIMPVPEAHWVDDDGSEMGTPSLISKFVKGVTKPSQGLPKTFGLGTHFSKEYRDLLGPEYTRYMVVLHRAEFPDSAFPSFVSPKVGATQEAQLILNWWGRTWAEDRYEEVPIEIVTKQWLRANARALDHLYLVHGDYRPGSFLFEKASGQITAVLDWELGYLGDRLADLGYILTDFYVTRENGVPFHCGLFPSENAVIEMYEARGGLAIDKKTLAWQEIFSTWKQLILTLDCAPRTGDGRSNQDVLLTYITTGGYAVSEALRRLLEQHG